MRAALFLIGGDHVSDWLVIYPGAEFIVRADTLRHARYAVECKALALGLRLYGKRHYDLYRLGGCTHAEE